MRPAKVNDGGVVFMSNSPESGSAQRAPQQPQQERGRPRRTRTSWSFSSIGRDWDVVVPKERGAMTKTDGIRLSARVRTVGLAADAVVGH